MTVTSLTGWFTLYFIMLLLVDAMCAQLKLFLNRTDKGFHDIFRLTNLNTLLLKMISVSSEENNKTNNI